MSSIRWAVVMTESGASLLKPPEQPMVCCDEPIWISAGVWHQQVQLQSESRCLGWHVIMHVITIEKWVEVWRVLAFRLSRKHLQGISMCCLSTRSQRLLMPSLLWFRQHGSWFTFLTMCLIFKSFSWPALHIPCLALYRWWAWVLLLPRVKCLTTGPKTKPALLQITPWFSSQLWT